MLYSAINFKTACLLFILSVSLFMGQEIKNDPEIRVGYNISCPIRSHGFYYHVWLLARPLEYAIIDVTNGITSGYEKGQLKGFIPERRPADVSISVFIKHNCGLNREFDYTPEEELGVCRLTDAVCSFYYTRNLLEKNA